MSLASEEGGGGGEGEGGALLGLPELDNEVGVRTSDYYCSSGINTHCLCCRECWPSIVIVVNLMTRGLPFLQDLTQYNTAHNRQISMVGIREDEHPWKRKYLPKLSHSYE